MRRGFGERFLDRGELALIERKKQPNDSRRGLADFEFWPRLHGPQVWSMMLAVDHGLRVKTQFDQTVDGIFESGWGTRIPTASEIIDYPPVAFTRQQICWPKVDRNCGLPVNRFCGLIQETDMPAFLITFWTAILRLYGLPVPTQASGKPSKRKVPVKTRTPAPSRTCRPRLSRVTGPRQALRLIADMVGQTSGIPRRPDPKDLELAWMILGDPVANFVQALIALGASVPMFLGSDHEEAELDKLAIKAKRSPRKFIKAIWREVPIRASFEAEAVLAHRVKKLFRGNIPQPEGTDSPAAERELHVVDSMDRPLICRVLEHGEGGRLEVLDGPGGFLHRDTLAHSCWRTAGGWLQAGVVRNRGPNHGDGDAPPNPELVPHPIQPRI